MIIPERFSARFYPRMSMVVALSAMENNTLKGFQSLTISVTGAAINLVLILVLNFIYNKIAAWLTDKELHRSQHLTMTQFFILKTERAKTEFISTLYPFTPSKI